MTMKALEGRTPPIVFHLSVIDHILFGDTNTKQTPKMHSTIPAITSCVIVLMICDGAKIGYWLRLRPLRLGHL